MTCNAIKGVLVAATPPPQHRLCPPTQLHTRVGANDAIAYMSMCIYMYILCVCYVKYMCMIIHVGKVAQRINTHIYTHTHTHTHTHALFSKGFLQHGSDHLSQLRLSSFPHCTFFRCPLRLCSLVTMQKRYRVEYTLQTHDQSTSLIPRPHSQQVHST